MTQSFDVGNVAGLQQPQPLRVSRTFHARRETVFKAWSAADHVRTWFSPRTYSVCDARVEMHVGGAFEACMLAPSGEKHWTRGTFVEVTPHSRLVIDMHATDPHGRPLFRAYTEVTFTDAPAAGTTMDVVQTYTFIDPAMAAPMVAGAPEGWRTTLDKLEQEVLRMSGAVGTDLRSVVHASFHLERRYDAPVERVWRALTDEAAKQKWFAGPPGEWELLERYMDVREGGRELLKGLFNGVVSTFDASYHDVVRHERLVYSYAMYLDDKKISVSLATMQLKSENGGTKLMVTEQGAFLDGYDDAGSREHGTAYLLDALGASLND